jgi:hypothetical protein
LKTCKKCKSFDEESFKCNEFNIHITSTLNATKCINYKLDSIKERNLQNSKQSKILKKDYQKKKRAKTCIGCESNQEGYCNKHKNWCGKVNYICLGIKNPYEYKPPKPKPKPKKKGKHKNKIKKNPKNLGTGT